jgi:hypothetical protein
VDQLLVETDPVEQVTANAVWRRTAAFAQTPLGVAIVAFLRTRGNMLASAILRSASMDEVKDRKKSYDDIFVRYNATLQSNMFRLREIFRTGDFTTFEDLMGI